MIRTHVSLALAAALVLAPCAVSASEATPGTAHVWLVKPEDVLPQRLLAQPPVDGGEVQTAELAFLKAMMTSASAERRAQAKADDANETPSIYNEPMGLDLTKLPAVAGLLDTIRHEADHAASPAKAAFARLRPWAFDKNVVACSEMIPSKAATSYPSGHASNGYSMAYALVRLAPEYAPGVLSRADDYAMSRVICGHHYYSDTQASRLLSAVVVERLWNDPRMADKIAAAKAELATAVAAK
jgi:acid phosphatase (class A)